MEDEVDENYCTHLISSTYSFFSPSLTLGKAARKPLLTHKASRTLKPPSLLKLLRGTAGGF